MFQSMAFESGRSARGPALSLTIHCGVVALLFLAGTNRGVQHAVKAPANLVAPLIAPYLPATAHGGGGGGDRSPLPASKERLPRIAPRQFTPPAAVLNNTNPKLAMDPTLVISPDVRVLRGLGRRPSRP